MSQKNGVFGVVVFGVVVFGVVVFGVVVFGVVVFGGGCLWWVVFGVFWVFQGVQGSVWGSMWGSRGWLLGLILGLTKTTQNVIWGSILTPSRNKARNS